MAKSKEMDMTNGPLMGKILVFTIPIILSSLLQILFNAADIMVISKFAGSESLAAVGSTSSIVSLLVNTFVGLSVGANAVTAMLIGYNDKRGISETVHTSMLTGFISGIILLFLGVIFVKPILMIMGSPENVIGKSALYLRIYFLSMPAMMIYNFGSAILRAFGDTKSPLIYISVAGIINLVLNLLFVIVFKLDVAGVAIGTTISQSVSAVLIIKKFLMTEEIYKITKDKLKINKVRMMQIFRIGIPAGIQSSIFSVSNMIVQSTINSFGSVVMAGNAAASSVDNTISIAISAFSQTSLTFTSQNYGAGKIDRIKKAMFGCQLYTMLFGIGFGLLLKVFAEPIMSIYIDDPEVMKYALIRYNIICMTSFLDCMSGTFGGVVRGLGYSITSLMTSVACVCGVRIVYLFTYFPAHRTFRNLFMCYPLSWGASLIIYSVILFFIFRKLDRRHIQQI